MIIFSENKGFHSEREKKGRNQYFQINFLTKSLVEFDKLLLKFKCVRKGPRIAKTVLKKNKIWVLAHYKQTYHISIISIQL